MKLLWSDICTCLVLAPAAVFQLLFKPPGPSHLHGNVPASLTTQHYFNKADDDLVFISVKISPESFWACPDSPMTPPILCFFLCSPNVNIPYSLSLMAIFSGKLMTMMGEGSGAGKLHFPFL